jgi:hypothetical protein
MSIQLSNSSTSKAIKDRRPPIPTQTGRARRSPQYREAKDSRSINKWPLSQWQGQETSSTIKPLRTKAWLPIEVVIKLTGPLAKQMFRRINNYSTHNNNRLKLPLTCRVVYLRPSLTLVRIELEVTPGHSCAKGWLSKCLYLVME